MLMFEHRAKNIMVESPLTISSDMLAYDALVLMEEKKITALPVVTNNLQIEGLIHMHQIIQEGLSIGRDTSLKNS